MKILIDTNVLLDFLQQRESFAEAEEILSLCGRNKVQGFVAAHSFPNMFFILRKYMDSAKRRDLLFYLTSLLGVVSIDYLKILSALSRADFRSPLIIHFQKITCNTSRLFNKLQKLGLINDQASLIADFGLCFCRHSKVATIP